MRRSTSTATGPEKQAIETADRASSVFRIACSARLPRRLGDGSDEGGLFLNLSRAEGFCIVVAEAMLAGLPVIAVDVGGIRDYGRDGENMVELSSAGAQGARAAILSLMRDSFCASASAARRGRTCFKSTTLSHADSKWREALSSSYRERGFRHVLQQPRGSS